MAYASCYNCEHLKTQHGKVFCKIHGSYGKVCRAYSSMDDYSVATGNDYDKEVAALFKIPEFMEIMKKSLIFENGISMYSYNTIPKARFWINELLTERENIVYILWRAGIPAKYIMKYLSIKQATYYRAIKRIRHKFAKIDKPIKPPRYHFLMNQKEVDEFCKSKIYTKITGKIKRDLLQHKIYKIDQYLDEADGPISDAE